MKRKPFNTKGLTLIELILTLALFGLVTMIVYPMLGFTYRTTNIQLKESNQRNEVRVVSNHLKNDIEYSKAIDLVDLYTLEIINGRGEQISYYMKDNGGSGSYLVRESETTTAFKDISDVEFELLNNHLVGAKIYTDAVNEKFTEFKIYRWNMTIDHPNNTVDLKEYIIANSVFVFVNQIEVFGTPYIYGDNATAIFRNGLEITGGEISNSYIYVDGDVSLKGNATLGNSDETSMIYVSGEIKGSGNTKIFGEVITGEEFEFPKIKIPPLKATSWYIENGYSPNTEPADNMKFFGNNITIDEDASDVIIVSNSTNNDEVSIRIRNKINVSGILFAPGSIVEIDDATFRGLIIAKSVYLKNKADVTFELVEMDDLPF
jgi:prepilin-type N-terminal cleavage/methylation domain-containing protein